MKTIRINFACRPQVHWPRLLALGGAILALSGLCLWFGIAQLTRQDSDLESQMGEVRRLKQQIADLGRQTTPNRITINRQKTKWQRTVNLANGLIRSKTYSPLARLDFLEGILPDGIQVTRLDLGSGHGSRLRLTVKTPAFSQLIALYKRLSPYRLDIHREGENQGFFFAILEISPP